ncbi:MAG: alpha/beta hydrolase [Oscillospiraceae bacterium]
MSEIQKNVISFRSASNTCDVAGYIYKCEAVTPRAVLQISHGMCEFIGRYDNFANFMVEHGFIVCGNDHLGHGKTSDNAGGLDGFFAEKDGRDFVVEDLHKMNEIVSEQYPNLPIILLGHSMGSFLARLYAVRYPKTIKALILSGTGGANPLGGIGIVLTKIIGKIKGSKYRSELINNIAFGSYLKQIPQHKTPYDWISHDEALVDIYKNNKKCTFIFTVSAFNDLMCTLRDVNTVQWAEKLDKNMPIYMFSGDKDPVGDYGKGLAAVEKLIQNAGVKDFTFKLYKDGRHEMLNETNRNEVYEDVLNWCNAHVA